MSQSSDSEYEDAESIHSDYPLDSLSINQNESTMTLDTFQENPYNSSINKNLKKKKSLNEHFLTVDVSRHNSATSPLGIQLAPITLYEKSFVIIAGWDHLPNGKLGIIQKSGLIRLGDVLVLINDVSVRDTAFRRVMNLLKNLMESNMLQSLTFCPSKEYYKDLVHLQQSLGNVSRDSFAGSAAKQRGRYAFFSTINSFRKVEKDDEGNVIPIADSAYASKQTYVEYEVSCYLLLRGVTSSNSTSTTNALSDGHEVRWSIWKRFSEFKTLDTALRQTYGWQMNAITNDSSSFPSSYSLSSFFLNNNKNSHEFLEKRCLELDNYWQAILQIEEMTDFTQPHRYSRELANFLSVKEHLQDVMKTSSNNTTTNQNSHDSSLQNNKTNSSSNISMLSECKSFQERRSRRNLELFHDDDNVHESSVSTIIKRQNDIINASDLSSKKIIPLKSPYERRLHGCLFDVEIMYPRAGRK